jgi:Family of unknown function (DUF6445)
VIRPDICARRIGKEGHPIAVIDGFSPDPDALRAQALTLPFSPASDHYPGVRAAVPSAYIPAQAALIAHVLNAVFGATTPASVLDITYSIVTTPATDLSLVQRLPHIDATSPDRIALVHYLSPGATEGTAFFRHRATEFETIDPSRGPHYMSTLDAELRCGQPSPSGYICDDTDLFERTHGVEGRFNRAVIYRSNMLHSGAITAQTPLSADPAIGRLTITGFLALS